MCPTQTVLIHPHAAVNEALQRTHTIYTAVEQGNAKGTFFSSPLPSLIAPLPTSPTVAGPALLLLAEMLLLLFRLFSLAMPFPPDVMKDVNRILYL